MLALARTGVICVANRLQITPVAVTANCCGYDTFSGGRCKSARFAMLMAHLKVGAQKWMVFGPWRQHAASRSRL